MKYVEDTCSVELSVRELCQAVYLGGDIDSKRRVSFSDLQSGSENHKKIQRDAGVFYTPEVELTNTSVYNEIYYTVSGRADGVIKKDGVVTVDEIKSVNKYEFHFPPKEIYLAQLKCYAYFLACRDELSRVCGQLTMYNTDSGKIKYHRYEFDVDDLRLWYTSLIMRISREGSFLKVRAEELLPSAASVVFPYSELREGQETMIRECYGAIRRGDRLFVEAPTGTGKTISSLYPAVRALGEGRADKVFYLTAKASTRREAYRAAGKLFEGGARLRTVVITAKEQVCMCGARIAGVSGNMCEPEKCEFAAGYYDKVKDAIFELLSRQNGFTRQIICEVAKKYRICPYELSLDLSEYCDIIICDYNYAFDPMVYFRRYFGSNVEAGKYIFLVDEAHNLADRARDMYSAEIRRSDIEKIYSKITADERELDKAFEKIITTVRALRRLCADNIIKTAEGEERAFYLSHSLPMKLCEELDIFKKKLEGWLKDRADSPLYADIEHLLSKIRRFTAIEECFDEHFLFYLEMSGNDMQIKIYCLDPSHILDIIQNRAISTVFFSATLTPSEYFCDILGGGKSSVRLELESPFERSNLCVAVADYLGVRFEDRKKNTAKYATAIAATVSAKHGNYIAYFPSYEMMESVAAAFSRKYPSVEIILQKRNMTMRQKEEFIDSFKDDKGVLRIGFSVLGGSFSEGVDLPGSRLIGTIIFGVGLPGLSNEKNIIRDYYEVRNGSGYDYAYTYPGMNNVLQAAGRVIRRAEDKGVVVLVDDRYGDPKYTNLFPEHWKGVKYAGNVNSLAEIVRRFWRET